MRRARNAFGAFPVKLITAVLLAVAPLALAESGDPDVRAGSTLAQMTQDEKLSMLRGFIVQTWPAGKFPADVPKGSGYVPGVPRLGIPALTEADGSLGVANMAGGERPNDEATAVPSGPAMAS